MYNGYEENEKLFKENRFCRHITSAENVFIILGLYGFFICNRNSHRATEIFIFILYLRTFGVVWYIAMGNTAILARKWHFYQ